MAVQADSLLAPHLRSFLLGSFLEHYEIYSIDEAWDLLGFHPSMLDGYGREITAGTGSVAWEAQKHYLH